MTYSGQGARKASVETKVGQCRYWLPVCIHAELAKNKQVGCPCNPVAAGRTGQIRKPGVLKIHLRPVVLRGIAQGLGGDQRSQALIPGLERRRGDKSATCALAEGDDAGGINSKLARVRLHPGDAGVHIVQGRQVGVLWCHAVVGRENLGRGLFGEVCYHVVGDGHAARDEAAAKGAVSWLCWPVSGIKRVMLNFLPSADVAVLTVVVIPGGKDSASDAALVGAVMVFNVSDGV